ncbi:hypothetical protein HOD20_02780 [archaeon]|jgi:phosphatidylglycerol---prolipoprotein diacylglyceryl transferase|nr:hypothetical protein [archaeon]MBT4351430.1 hypothetical protein [archaeon]MBT4647279.1 hypothetical protein [archaeon]MBT6821158.1 hypothetical protein [archaeon]MBT7391674.1 hypothetical protein [archaeon]
MIDEHFHPKNWGIRPILFSIGNIEIPAYSFFVLLGLVVGAIVYFKEVNRKKKTISENSIYIALCAMGGGILGSKIPIWIYNYKIIIALFPDITPILSGRTIVGGIIGGMIGVRLIKHYLKIKNRRGNFFAPAAALGISIGRIGCFFRGCCYGIETTLPWGVDFGDGIQRHPTQIYETIFAFLLFLYLTKIKKKIKKPGRLFDIFLTIYFSYRFISEFIRDINKTFYGLSIFQIISLIVIIYANRGPIANYLNKMFNM